MVDSRTATGSSSALVVDVSRCLRMRFSDSSCRRCADNCPHEAVSLDSGLAIDSEQCRGCLLCTAACPVGALEQNNDFSACVAKLSKVPDPVLGCIRTRELSNATLACLGGLSEEHLVALSHTLTGRLTLNLSLCGDCPNSQMIAKLEQRLDSITAAGLASSNCLIVIAGSAQDIHYRDESVDRRSFFKSFSNALFKNAAVILTAPDEKTGQRSEYAGKRLPYRRALLNSTGSKLSQELESHLHKFFDSCIAFNENCTKCQGCVAICPTGALQTEQYDIVPLFEQKLCTGCGLCGEFCMDGAVRIV